MPGTCAISWVMYRSPKHLFKSAPIGFALQAFDTVTQPAFSYLRIASLRQNLSPVTSALSDCSAQQLAASSLSGYRHLLASIRTFFHHHVCQRLGADEYLVCVLPLASCIVNSNIPSGVPVHFDWAPALQAFGRVTHSDFSCPPYSPTPFSLSPGHITCQL